MAAYLADGKITVLDWLLLFIDSPAYHLALRLEQLGSCLTNISIKEM